MKRKIWNAIVGSLIGILICVVGDFVFGYSEFGAPSEFGNESTTTCLIGGDGGIVNCTGIGYFGGVSINEVIIDSISTNLLWSNIFHTHNPVEPLNNLIAVIESNGTTGVHMPHFWVQGGAAEQASGISRSFMIVNEVVALQNTTNITSCTAVQDMMNVPSEHRIDCNTTETGADLLVSDDMLVGGTIRVTDSVGEYHDMNRAMQVLDEYFNNILFNRINTTIIGGFLNITDRFNETLILSLNAFATNLQVKSDKVALDTGTTTSPAFNFISYQDQDNPVLTVDSSVPADTVDNAKVVRAYIGANVNEVYLFEDITSHGFNALDHIYDRFDDAGAIYKSGLGISSSATEINISTGSVRLRIAKTDYMNNVSSGSDFYFVNSTGNFINSSGNTIFTKYSNDADVSNNKYLNIIWGVVPINGSNMRLVVVVQDEPTTEYGSLADAEADKFGTVNFFPNNDNLKKVFIPVARTIIKETGSDDFQLLPGGLFHFDIRGQVTAAGGSPAAPPITEHQELGNLAWSAAGHTIDTTVDFGGNKLNDPNITNASISASDVGRDIPVNCSTNYAVTGWENNLSTTYCTQFEEPGDYLENGTDKDVHFGRVGIGTATPSEIFEILSDDSDMDLTTVSTSGQSSFHFRRANGTVGSPTAVGAGYELGSFSWWGYNGADYVNAVKIDVEADDAFNATSRPASMSFWTAPAGSTTKLERLIIRSDGNIGIGTSTPDETLEVFNGNIKIGDDANTARNLILERNSVIIGKISTGNDRTTIQLNNAKDFEIVDTDGNTGMYVDDAGSYLRTGFGTTAPAFYHVIDQDLDALTGSLIDVSNLHMVIKSPSNTVGDVIGIGFQISSAAGTTGVGGAMVLNRTGSGGAGKLMWGNKPIGGGEDIPIGMTLEDGNLEVMGNITVGDNVFGDKLYANNIEVTPSLYLTNGTDAEFVNLAVDTDTLFVKASTDKVGISTNDPTYDLDIVGDIGIDDKIYHNDDVAANTYFSFAGEDKIEIFVGGLEFIELFEAIGDVVRINPTGAGSLDFCVYDDDLSYLLYADAGIKKVGIGTNTPSTKLEVVGNITAENVHITAPPGCDEGDAVKWHATGELYCD